MAATDARLSTLSKADRQRLEQWLLDFGQNWDEQRLAAWMRTLPANCPWRAAALGEAVKVDLQKQWQRGHRLKVEDYLRLYPEVGNAETVPADLLLVELQVRRQIGEVPGLDDYARRFPRRADELRRLAALSETSAEPTEATVP